MKYLARLLAVLLLVSGCSDSTLDLETSSNEPLEEGWTWVPYDSDLLQISGRANYESGEFVILSWSASSITIAFIGTALKLKTGTNNNVYLDVFVDGEEIPSSLIKLTYSQHGAPSIVPVVSNLPQDTHVVTLYKKSEGFVGDWYFYGVRVFGRIPKDIVPEPAERKIEFIGNSITCGCDVVAPGFGLAFDPVNEDSYYSYAGQTGRILGAEIHTICYSGHGVYINVDGSKVSPT